jgi:hypothetical protein
MDLEPPHPAVRLGPGEARIAQGNRGRVDQFHDFSSFAVHTVLGLGHQMHANVAKDCGGPASLGIAQGRTARHSQPQIVKPAGMRVQGLLDLTQGIQPRKLSEQHGLQMPDASPRPWPGTHPVIPAMTRHDPVQNPPIKRFQKPMNDAKHESARQAPQLLSRQHNYGTIPRICLPGTLPSKIIPDSNARRRG